MFQYADFFVRFEQQDIYYKPCPTEYLFESEQTKDAYPTRTLQSRRFNSIAAGVWPPSSTSAGPLCASSSATDVICCSVRPVWAANCAMGLRSASTFAMACARASSEPGRIGSHKSARLAVRLSRGSAWMRRKFSRAAMTLPGVPQPSSSGAPAFGALPGSRRELMDAASALPGSTLLLDRSATQQRLKSEALDSYEVLHFAVRVAVDTERPDRTALVLADGPGSTEDGLLQAREIAHLRLGARLVVLSGCNTARPVFESSFANASLVRSFLFAGAKSVVATLWTIDDTFTAYLMGQFYAYLGRGSDAGTALEQAKRDAIRRYGNAGMPLWAGFQLVGNGEETMERGGGL